MKNNNDILLVGALFGGAMLLSSSKDSAAVVTGIGDIISDKRIKIIRAAIIEPNNDGAALKKIIGAFCNMNSREVEATYTYIYVYGADFQQTLPTSLRQQISNIQRKYGIMN